LEVGDNDYVVILYWLFVKNNNNNNNNLTGISGSCWNLAAQYTSIISEQDNPLEVRLFD
jgi:hypothetical protein